MRVMIFVMSSLRAAFVSFSSMPRRSAATHSSSWSAASACNPSLKCRSGLSAGKVSRLAEYRHRPLALPEREMQEAELQPSGVQRRIDRDR